MQVGGLTAGDIRANLRQAMARVEAALEEYESARAELAWWHDGLRLVDPEAAAALDASQEPGAIVAELFPDGSVFETGARPTLRQAIVLVMRDNTARRWTVHELVAALDEQGWLPDRGDAAKRVSDMAGEMVRVGQLGRVDRGIYVLAPQVSAALQAEKGRQK